MAGLEERLTQLLRGHIETLRYCPCGEWQDAGPGPARVQHNYAEHLARVVLEELAPRLETVEQLDALPVGAVVGFGNGCGLYEKDRRGSWGWGADEPDDGPALIAESLGTETPLRLVWLPSWVGVTDQ